MTGEKINQQLHAEDHELHGLLIVIGKERAERNEERITVGPQLEQDMEGRIHRMLIIGETEHTVLTDDLGELVVAAGIVDQVTLMAPEKDIGHENRC